MSSARPPRALTVIDGTSRVCVVQDGVDGYLELDCHFDTETDARRFADRANLKLGVSHAQRMALTFGSMFGWDTPGAQPDTPLCLSATSLADELASDCNAENINSRTYVVINPGEEDESTTTFGAFTADNADAIADGMINIAEIRQHLAEKGSYRGGGGAAASWTIELYSLRCPVCKTRVDPEKGCANAYRCFCGDWISCDDYCGQPLCPGYKIRPDDRKAQSDLE